MGQILLSTILIAVFGIISGVVFISDYFNKQLLSYLVKPLVIPLLSIFYILTAAAIKTEILLAFLASFFAFILLINNSRPKIIMLMMSIFYIFFSIIIAKNSYYLEYIPIWFYTYFVLMIVFLFFINIKFFNKSDFYYRFIFLFSYSLLFYMILCRAWKYYNYPLVLPLVAAVLFLVFSISFIYNHYNSKQSKNRNINLLLSFSNIYGQLLLLLGIMTDW